MQNHRASCDGLSLNFTIVSPFFVLCDTSVVVFLISVDVIWQSLYTILLQFSSCATDIPEISSMSLLPYCSGWFLLTFTSFNTSWRLFSVLLMIVQILWLFDFYDFLLHAYYTSCKFVYFLLYFVQLFHSFLDTLIDDVILVSVAIISS